MPAQEPIKLYDSQTSPNCHRVKVVLEEKQIPYELVPIDLKKGEQKRPDFLKLNPYGKVPVIIDDSTVVYESCIINEYLEDKYPQRPLLPKDPGARARIRILIDYGLNHFAPPYQRLRLEVRDKDENERNAHVMEKAAAELVSLFKRLEQGNCRPPVSGRRVFPSRCGADPTLFTNGAMGRRNSSQRLPATCGKLAPKNEGAAFGKDFSGHCVFLI